MTQAAALEELTEELLASYLGDERGRRISHGYLPSREGIVEILTTVLDLMYPGYFGRQDLNAENLGKHVEQMIAALAPRLEHEIEQCLCYGREREAVQPALGECAPRAHELAEIFLRRLPQIRGLLIRDVQAAGCDIHPGATIGAAFFIDHATGVVIGETTHIGEGVKIYQGVTLGALSLPRDASGHIIRGKKRHPTVEDGSTLYANATVLGGQTVVGAGSVIGGSVFLTRSVPPRSRVSLKEPELRVLTRDGAAEPDAIYFDI